MNNNNYTPFVEFVKEKEQTEFFFQLGLYIRPYHGFQLSGTCTCGNEDCTTPGKHPVFNNSTGFYKNNEYKKWLAKNPFCTNIGLATGYYKKLGKSLVVIDIDDVKHLEKMQSYFPSMHNTFTVKTRNGFHYYFWVPGNINPTTNENNCWINSRLTAEGMRVDILGQKRTVLSPNSFGKKIISNISIATLSEEEIKKIQSLKSQSNPVNYIKNKSSSEGNAIITDFYKGDIKRGSYHHALAHVSGYILRRNAKRIINGLYTKTNHEDFMIGEALKYLGAPVDIKKVKKQAGGMYKKFDVNKFNSPTQTFDHYFQRKDPSIKSLLKDILQNKFQTIPVQPAKGRSLSWGMSLAEVRRTIEETLIQNGIDPTSFRFGDDSLKKFLSMFHDINKIENDKMIDGKRIRGKRWNLMLSSSMNASMKEDKGAGTSDLVPSMKEDKGAGTLMGLQNNTFKQPQPIEQSLQSCKTLCHLSQCDPFFHEHDQKKNNGNYGGEHPNNSSEKYNHIDWPLFRQEAHVSLKHLPNSNKPVPLIEKPPKLHILYSTILQ